ncbi:MAG: hypothetical protein IJ309_02440 [Clostridia bacterium]|nr:hypothetical protein [Clostridia bacterium]
MSKRIKKKNEFRRKNMKDGKGHPSYIFAQQGNEYIFLGITHSKITNGVKNIKLEKNPNPKDKRDSYVRPKVEKYNKSSFGKKLKGWHFSDKDKQTVEYITKK